MVQLRFFLVGQWRDHSRYGKIHKASWAVFSHCAFDVGVGLTVSFWNSRTDVEKRDIPRDSWNDAVGSFVYDSCAPQFCSLNIVCSLIVDAMLDVLAEKPQSSDEHGAILLEEPRLKQACS